MTRKAGAAMQPTAERSKVPSTGAEVASAVSVEVRLYDNLFAVADPEAGDFMEALNPDSLLVLEGCQAEPYLSTAQPGDSFQFMRQGYFCRMKPIVQRNILFLTAAYP